jgi:hypothetical protein
MGGHEAHRLRMIAMGQWNARIRGAGEGGGDARHDFEGDVVIAQEFQLLAAAAEHERIAALEPDHAPAGAGVFEHQRVDALLGGVMTAGFLGHFDELRIAAGKF